MPETCRVFYKIKFGKFVGLVGFVKKELVAMHGHLTVLLVVNYCKYFYVRSVHTARVPTCTTAANTTRHTPHAVVYIVCSPDDGHNDGRNMLS